MVWHLVLMKPRPDLPPEEGRKLLEAFQRAVAEIPSVREIRMARRVRHGASYEGRAPDSADFLVSLGFDDLAGLQLYLTHPTHADLGARFNQSLSSALIYDLESVSIGDLWREADRSATQPLSTTPEAS